MHTVCVFVFLLKTKKSMAKSAGIAQSVERQALEPQGHGFESASSPVSDWVLILVVASPYPGENLGPGLGLGKQSWLQRFITCKWQSTGDVASATVLRVPVAPQNGDTVTTKKCYENFFFWIVQVRDCPRRCQWGLFFFLNFGRPRIWSWGPKFCAWKFTDGVQHSCVNKVSFKRLGPGPTLCPGSSWVLLCWIYILLVF